MTHRERLHAHRVGARRRVEKWIVVWTAMHPEETLRGGVGDSVVAHARQLLTAMKEAEDAAAEEEMTARLNAIPVMPTSGARDEGGE